MKNILSKLVWAAACVTATGLLLAQNAVVSGRVTDLTDAVVPGANIASITYAQNEGSFLAGALALVLGITAEIAAHAPRVRGPVRVMPISA